MKLDLTPAQIAAALAFKARGKDAPPLPPRGWEYSRGAQRDAATVAADMEADERWR